MPARFIIFLLLPLLWLAGCTSAPGETGMAVNRRERTLMIQGDFPVLANGLSAEEVRQRLGEPAEIRPLKSAVGNSEVWIYYLEKYLGKTEVISYVNRPTAGGTSVNDPYTLYPEPVFSLVDHSLLLTLRLLLFEGRIASQSTKSEHIIGS